MADIHLSPEYGACANNDTADRFMHIWRASRTEILPPKQIPLGRRDHPASLKVTDVLSKFNAIVDTPLVGFTVSQVCRRTHHGRYATNAPGINLRAELLRVGAIQNGVKPLTPEFDPDSLDFDEYGIGSGLAIIDKKERKVPVLDPAGSHLDSFPITDLVEATRLPRATRTFIAIRRGLFRPLDPAMIESAIAFGTDI